MPILMVKGKIIRIIHRSPRATLVLQWVGWAGWTTLYSGGRKELSMAGFNTVYEFCKLYRREEGSAGHP